jgi:hypothetical protein
LTPCTDTMHRHHAQTPYTDTMHRQCMFLQARGQDGHPALSLPSEKHMLVHPLCLASSTWQPNHSFTSALALGSILLAARMCTCVRTSVCVEVRVLGGMDAHKSAHMQVRPYMEVRYTTAGAQHVTAQSNKSCHPGGNSCKLISSHPCSTRPVAAHLSSR